MVLQEHGQHQQDQLNQFSKLLTQQQILQLISDKSVWDYIKMLKDGIQQMEIHAAITLTQYAKIVKLDALLTQPQT